MNSDAVDVRNFLLNYIDTNCIYRITPGEPELPGLPPGTTYTWQFYLRRGLTDQTFLRSVAALFWFQFKSLYYKTPFQITGLETGATPLVTALIMTGPPGCGGFITRAERKTYGLKNRFEGCIDGRPVMLVDDMCNSKNTMVRAMQYCEEEGLKIYKYGFTIVNKDVDGQHSDHDKYIGSKFKIISLFKHSDFHLTWQAYKAYATEYNISPKPWFMEIAK